jgi:hypothetical protein
MRDQSAVEGVLRAALTIANTRYLTEGHLAPYNESIDGSVGYALELASALLSDLANASDPFEEIGPEPMGRSEAVALVSSFLERCCELFAEPAPRPYMCMAIRAQTLADFLLEPASED